MKERKREREEGRERDRERKMFLTAICEMLFTSRAFKAMANFQTARKRFREESLNLGSINVRRSVCEFAWTIFIFSYFRIYNNSMNDLTSCAICFAFHVFFKAYLM